MKSLAAFFLLVALVIAGSARAIEPTPSSPPAPDAIVLARIEDGRVSPGNPFVVGLLVQDWKGTAPAAALRLRLHFSTSAVRYIDLVSNAPGTSISINEVANAPRPTPDFDTALDLTITGDIPTTGTRNLVAKLRFRTEPKGRMPFSILLEKQPAQASALLDAGGHAITSQIVDGALKGLSLRARSVAPAMRAAAPAGPAAVIDSTIVEEGPLKAGDTFTLKIFVRENPTGHLPISCNFRVYYPGEKIEYVSQKAGGLGGLYAGPVRVNDFDPAHPSRYRDVVSVGNFNALTLTPTCFTVAFRVKADAPAGPFALVVEGDPRSSAPLIGPTSSQKIAHTYDNSHISKLYITEPNVPPATTKESPEQE